VACGGGGILTHYSMKTITHNGYFPVETRVTVLPDGKIADRLFASTLVAHDGIFGGSLSYLVPDALASIHAALADPAHPLNTQP